MWIPASIPELADRQNVALTRPASRSAGAPAAEARRRPASRWRDPQPQRRETPLLAASRRRASDSVLTDVALLQLREQRRAAPGRRRDRARGEPRQPGAAAGRRSTAVDGADLRRRKPSAIDVQIPEPARTGDRVGRSRLSVLLASAARLQRQRGCSRRASAQTGSKIAQRRRQRV